MLWLNYVKKKNPCTHTYKYRQALERQTRHKWQQLTLGWPQWRQLELGVLPGHSSSSFDTF